MVFAAKPAMARWEGVALAVWIVLFDVLLVVWALRRPIDLLQFLLFLAMALSIPVLIHLLYRTWAAFSLEYWVDRNTITLRWAHLQQVIPTQSVREIAQGALLPIDKRWSLLRWPMPFLAIASQPTAQSVNLCATRPPAECIVLKTDAGLYALSPADADGFVEALQARYRLGPTQVVTPERMQRAWLANVFADDPQGVWLLAIGLIGVLLLFSVLTISFPDLPDVLAVRYNSQGLPEEIREKSALFRLLVIGLLAWSVNAIGGIWFATQRQRIGAHMLWGGAIVVQVFLLLALVSLIT
ncbi:MAG: PH domain-containing protein [Caldilinea sp.]